MEVSLSALEPIGELLLPTLLFKLVSLLLKNLLDFNCGAVYDMPSAASRFQVENLDKIINHVIPHFAEYPLHTVKKDYFEIFSQVCHLLQ